MSGSKNKTTFLEACVKYVGETYTKEEEQLYAEELKKLHGFKEIIEDIEEQRKDT